MIVPRPNPRRERSRTHPPTPSRPGVRPVEGERPPHDSTTVSRELVAFLSDPRRVLTGRIGGFTAHSRNDSREMTANARAAFLARFIDEVDPGRELPEAERERRATAARKAHFARLALASAEARRKRGAA